MPNKAVFLALLLLGSFPAESSAEDDRCGEIHAPQDILQCALTRHPDIVGAKADKFRDEKLVEIAKQRPNPELQSRILGGQSADDTHLNTETSLSHTVELGGKRKSRMGQAKRLAEKSEIGVKRIQEDVALQTVLTLYRLRQLESERDQIDETLATFGKILSRLRSRPQLTPEQAVSRSSFGLAREDYKLKKISLIQEQSNLCAWVEVATGIADQIILRHLPPSNRSWPDLSVSIKSGELSNATLDLARSEQALAEATLSVANAQAWPDLKIGPSFDTEDGGGTRWFGGVNFSVPLPILTLNRGEQAFAKAEQSRAQTILELAIRKAESERTLQGKRYQAAIEALRSSQSVSGLAIEHQNIEGFFAKGLVSSTLVIETHNQLYEITRTRNEQELAGVDALWRLYIIDGKVLDSKI